MAAFTHKVFFTETRGTGTYTRVQIDIEGDKEPLVINLDIPGIAPDAGAVLDDAIANAVAERVIQRTQALETAKTLLDSVGGNTIESVAPAVQQRINDVTEELGLTAVVLPIKELDATKADSLRTWLDTNNISADIAPTTRTRIIDADIRDIGTIDPIDPIVRG